STPQSRLCHRARKNKRRLALLHLQKTSGGRLMQRYMIPESLHNFPEGTIKVSGDFVHHMKNVMRFKSGSKVLVTDPAGKSAYAEIVELFEDAVELAWLADEEKESELPITVTIACGLPKGDKLDLIVQKATELGVTNI